MMRRPPASTLSPYTTLFQSGRGDEKPALAGLGIDEGARERRVLGRRPGAVLDDHALRPDAHRLQIARDRKSTRLNSSHANISYAVFCLHKKHVSLAAFPFLQ